MRLALFILRRLVLLIPILLGISMITFAMTHIIPANPVYIILGPYASKEAVAQMTEQLGLNKPLWEQYWIYLMQLLQGDLGFSYRASLPVADELMRRFPATFELTTLGMIIALIIGIPIGVMAAVKRGSKFDHFARVFSVGGVSIPVFWSGLILIYIFYFRLQIAPAPMGRLDMGVSPPTTITGMYLIDSLITGNWTALGSTLRHMALPAITLAFAMTAPTIRITRAAMLEVLASPYIRAARAYGVPSRRVIFRDALKNAMLPVVTSTGAQYGYSLGGEVLIEIAFAYPGMGSYAVNSILSNDFAPVQAFVLVTALLYVLINLTVDVIYAAIDPRISY